MAMQAQKNYFIKTFGCQMNVYDSQKMADILENNMGYKPTEDVNTADLILVNTCSIREKAQEKLFDQLGRFKKLKAKNQDLLIGVGGCVASQEGDAIIKRAPHVDLVFGPQTLHRIPELVETRLKTKKATVDIRFPGIDKFDALPAPRAEGVKAFVSIMEGCSKYCSYCVVPYTRGDELSRPFDDVLAECAMLADQGVREITLLGQNVNHYLGKMADGNVADLALLIDYIAALDGILRIRFTTSHPVEFSSTLIDAYKEVPKLANHLHLPVQSGSDRVLALMKRGHTALEFKSKMRALRAVRPDICISTDMIVGFPGETEADFQQTLDLVETIGFDQSFSFIYSARPGTPAAQIPDDTPMSEKKDRLARLQALFAKQARDISQNMVGKSYPVLVDGPSKQDKNVLSSRSENNRIVHFHGPKSLIGQIIPVTITEALPNCLRGRLE